MRRIFAIGVLFLACLHLPAMDRFAALSLIESGDNDLAKGPNGEISRFQMQPDVWKRFARTNASWTNAVDSLEVAKAVMQARCAAFERASNRPPTDVEFYVLWNAPAQVSNPRKSVSRRAERFSNLLKFK
jgi:hypothetical protein